MKVQITVTDEDVRKAIAHILKTDHNIEVDPQTIAIYVRSKQNYKNDQWERGEFKFEHTINVSV